MSVGFDDSSCGMAVKEKKFSNSLKNQQVYHYTTLSAEQHLIWDWVLCMLAACSI